MRKRSLWFLTALLLPLCGWTIADRSRGGSPVKYEPRAAKTAGAGGVEGVAKQTWEVMDLVQARHIDPPTRPEMILGAARGLVRAARGAHAPYRLSERASGLNTFEQFQALVQELWPAQANEETAAKLQQAMLEGLLAVAPGHPMLMTPEQVRVENSVTASRYTGIGVSYQHNDEEDMPQVVTPFRHGPAHRFGVKPGDLLVKIDGKKTKGIDLEETASWVRGKEGTPVTIVFRQPHSTIEQTIRIIRGVIPIETVVGYRRGKTDDWDYQIDPALPIGYLDLSALHSSTLHELRQAESKLKSAGIRALVLDLRYLGEGTVVHQARLVGDSLVGGGPMWRLCDAQGQVQEDRSSRECLFRNWPLVVLINEEMTDPMFNALAAALRDNGRAVLVGETAKTDEFIKTEVDLPNHLGGVMLPTARVERSDRERGWPLKPDQLVTTTPVQRAVIQQWLRDKDLTELPPGITDQPPDDPQVAQAVALLKERLQKNGEPVQQANSENHR